MKKPPEPEMIKGAVAIGKVIGCHEGTFRRYMRTQGHPLRRVVQMDPGGGYIVSREDLEMYLGSLPTVAARRDGRK